MNLSRLYMPLWFGRSGYSLYFQKQPRLKFSTSGKCSVAIWGERSPFTKGLSRNIHASRHIPDISRLSKEPSVVLHQRLRQQECVRCYASAPSDCGISIDSIFSPSNKCRVQAKLQSNRCPPRKDRNVAACIVPLCTINKEPSILFVLRCSKQKNRSEVSFPGGDMDKCDKDVTDTALKQTYEQIGISQEAFDTWGVMHPIPSKDGCKSIYPVLASCGEIDLCKLSPKGCSEVEEVFTIRIQDLIDNCKIKASQIRTESGFTVPVYLGGVYKVMGLTSIIVHQTLSLVAPGLYTYKLKRSC